jgi:hypothetical protein
MCEDITKATIDSREKDLETRPKVSIIGASHNRGRYLEDMMKSV